MEQSLNKIARIISTVFVPPSFTLIVFTLFAFVLESEFHKQLVIISTSFVFGFAAPIALFVVLRKKKKLINLDASIKEERTFPFLISTLFYLVGLLILIGFEVNIISIAFWFCYISNTLITIFINKRWKISAHSMGASGPLAAVTFVFGPMALIFLVIVLSVGWSRIQLKVHNVAQVSAGILLAFISTYLQIYFITEYFK